MSFPLAIFLGLVQGLTEFLPVSSSGHLVLMQKILGINALPVFFMAMVHLGTLGAVLLFFRKELVREFRDPPEAGKLLKRVVIGSVPVVLVGCVAQQFVKAIFGNLVLVGLGFLVTAALLFWSKRLALGQKRFQDLTNLQTLTIGLFQAVAVFPGISRSGATIVGGLSQKLDRESAFKFSFYLSIPAIIGANVLQLKNLPNLTFLPQSLVGMVAAFVVGYFALKLLQKVLIAGKLYCFSGYCLLIGAISLAFSVKL